MKCPNDHGMGVCLQLTAARASHEIMEKMWREVRAELFNRAETLDEVYAAGFMWAGRAGKMTARVWEIQAELRERCKATDRVISEALAVRARCRANRLFELGDCLGCRFQYLCTSASDLEPTGDNGDDDHD